MATNFPGSLDSFTNPTSGSTLDSPSHASQHANINDAMEAVQAKLGTGAGTIGERVAFTPSWSNFTPGNATESWWYVRVNQMLFVFGMTRLGSTSSVSGSIRIDVPVGQRTNQFYNCGVLQCRDDSTSSNYAGVFRSRDNSANNEIDLLFHQVSGSLIAEPPCNASSPFTWTTDDAIRGAFTVGLE